MSEVLVDPVYTAITCSPLATKTHQINIHRTQSVVDNPIGYGITQEVAFRKFNVFLTLEATFESSFATMNIKFLKNANLREKEKSHVILHIIFLLLLAIFSFLTIWLSVHLYDTSSKVKKEMVQTMDPASPDPGKTNAENTDIDSNAQKVKLGIYFERIEELDIKQSRWVYEFYIWFSWNPKKIDFLGTNSKEHLNEIPFSTINGEIISSEIVQTALDTANNSQYIQYLVKAKNTQFFDVSLYPVDEHDLIVPIEHKWLDRSKLVFIPDTLDSKISSRVNVNGYERMPQCKLIEKPHAYKSARGNPSLKSGFKVNFSQLRMAMRIRRGGLSSILKLFVVLYVAVLVTFIAPFSSDPSRYTVGALFTTAGANYILAQKLPAVEIFTFAEIINTVCLVIIVLMMALLAILPSIIFADGKADPYEKKLNRRINITCFSFFVVINFLLTFIVLQN